MPARLIALLFSAAMLSPGGEIRRLSILHSNDLHARLSPDDRKQGGFAYLATAVREQRAGCKHCLYVHAGDLVQGTPVSTLFQGMPVYEIANRLGFDAATIGNHEFDYGWQFVSRYIRKAKFPLVSANIVNQAGAGIAKPYVIRKTNGIRVAIIGMVMGDLVEAYLTPALAGPWRTRPVVETARQLAAELKDKADVTIVLGHISPADGSKLLREVGDIDVVVEGHSHIGRSQMERAGDRVAVGCRANGVELCRLDLEVEMQEGRIVAAKWERFPVDSTRITAAPDVQKQVAKWEKRVEQIVGARIGDAERDFVGADLQLLIEQAMRDEMGADLSHMNRGGIRDRLPKGPVLARHAWNVMPFDNRMVTARVKGSQLARFPARGVTIDPDREYTIALFDYLVNNEAQRTLLGLDGMTFTTHDLLLRDLLINWIKKQGVLR